MTAVLNKRKPAARTVRTKVDKAVSLRIRSIGECLSCGSRDRSLECCHLISRGEMCLRAHPLNVVCLCNQCHREFTMKPHRWTDFIESRFPGRWLRLDQIIIEHRESRKKIDWDEWLKHWQS